MPRLFMRKLSLASWIQAIGWRSSRRRESGHILQSLDLDRFNVAGRISILSSRFIANSRHSSTRWTRKRGLVENPKTSQSVLISEVVFILEPAAPISSSACCPEMWSRSRGSWGTRETGKLGWSTCKRMVVGHPTQRNPPFRKVVLL